MSNQSTIVRPVRSFVMGATRFPDPDPTMKPDDVRKVLAVNFPALNSATVEGPEIKGEELEYTFAPPPAKTKG